MNKKIEEFVNEYRGVLTEYNRSLTQDGFEKYRDDLDALITSVVEEERERCVNELMDELPENRDFYKDSGIWTMLSDDGDVLLVQDVNEKASEFFAKVISNKQ